MLDYTTVKIQLPNNKSVLVDKCDADLADMHWGLWQGQKEYASRSVMIDGGYHTVFMHRVILERILGRSLESKELCDHVNNDSLDNRRCNLRLATHAENIRNAKKRKHSKNEYKGISKKGNRWRARIQYNGQRIYLGSFFTPEEAYKAYCEAAIKYHDKFACLE